MREDGSARRNYLKTLLLTAGGMGLMGAMRQLLAAGESPVLPGVARLEGVLRVNGKSLRPGDAVSLPATLESGADSRAVFVVGRSAFLVRDNVRVELSGEGDVVRSMRVLTGRILSVFEHGAREVRTPAAVIGIRGTGMYLDVMPEQTYFCLCYGEADLMAVDYPVWHEHLQTHHHDSPRMIYASGEQMIVRERVKGHDDDELIMLEALVGRVPPFHSAWGGGPSAY